MMKATPAVPLDRRLPGRLRTFPAGSEIFSRGQPCTGLYQVLEGSVLVYTVGSGNEEIVVHMARRGDVVGALAAMDLGPHETSARAVTRCSLLFVSPEELRESLGAATPSASARALGEFARSLVRRVELLSRATVTDRLLALMSARAEPDGEGGAWVRLPETRAELAALLATTRESVSRAISRLRDDGVLDVKGDRVHLRVLPRAAGGENKG